MRREIDELSVITAEVVGLLLGTGYYNCCITVTSLFSDSQPQCTIKHTDSTGTYMNTLYH